MTYTSIKKIPNIKLKFYVLFLTIEKVILSRLMEVSYNDHFLIPIIVQKYHYRYTTNLCLAFIIRLKIIYIIKEKIIIFLKCAIFV